MGQERWDARVRLGLNAVLTLLAVLALACGSETPSESLDPPTAVVPTPADTPTAPTTSAGVPTASPTAGSTPAAPTPAPAVVSSAVPIPAVPAGEKLNLIAYSDREGRVFVANPDGGAAARIEPCAGFFSRPVWSPSGDDIVFSGIPGESGAALEMHSYCLGDERARVIFTNEPRAGPILPNMAHYPLWAPDGSRIAIIATTERMLSLFLLDPSGSGGAELVLQQAPLYLSWSADSRHMVVHGGDQHFVVDTGGGLVVTDLEDREINYRVPAWWPSGERYAFVTQDQDGERSLFVADPYSGRRTLLDTVPGDAAFLWSPDGRTLAVAKSRSPAGGVYQGIELFLVGGARRGVEILDDVFAFYWSPDSTKLAYVTLVDGQGVFRWNVLTVADGSSRGVVDFTPSSPQITLFQFFDQFAYSHTTWSPDSDALVFAGTMTGGAISAAAGSAGHRGDPGARSIGIYNRGRAGGRLVAAVMPEVGPSLSSR